MTSQPNDAAGDPDLGRLIRAQRRRRHLTHDALAAELGVHRSTLSRWEAGDVTPSPANLAALEHALEIRFVDDGDGHYAAMDAVPDTPPDAPRVVVVVVASAEEAVEVVRRIQQGLDPT